jgi:hypothetical protein
MANERRQQTKKSYRQKGQAAKVSLTDSNGSPSGPPDGVLTVDARKTPSANMPISTPNPIDIGVRAIAAVEILDHAIRSEESSTSGVHPQPAQNEDCQDNGNAWSHAVETKLNELIERSRSFERERLEIESLRDHLRQAIETAESRLTSTDSNAGKPRFQELETKLIAVQQENTKLSSMLLHARAEYQELLSFIESEAVDGESQAELRTIAQKVLEKTDARETELALEVSQLNDQLHFLQSELKEAKGVYKQSSPDDSELRIQVEQLRSQLLEARHEAVELRMQSNDLGSRLAKFQGVASGQKSETLTWEQRKEALLQQLEAETRTEAPCDPRKVLDIERILEQTSVEIQRRDQEISDLKTLIEQQSIAHDGMSIGVGAIAEMIESDSLIVAERLRLKELRDDWEQKQRQAEIEMSMERAKLARERLELQEKTRTFHDNNPPQTEEELKSNKASSRGRWLARLGLRDE